MENCTAETENTDTFSLLFWAGAEIIGPGNESGCGGGVNEVDVFFYGYGKTVEGSDGFSVGGHVGVKFGGAG